MVDDGTLWSFLESEGTFSVTSATDIYTYATISATLGDLIGLVDDSNGRPLTPLSWEALERAASSTQDQEASGQPEAFATWDSKIRVFPKPDATYTLRWFGRLAVTALSANGDAAPMPAAWRFRVLVPYAAAQLCRIESGFSAENSAVGYESLFQQGLMALRIAFGAATRPNMGVVEPGYERRWGPADASGWSWAP